MRELKFRAWNEAAKKWVHSGKHETGCNILGEMILFGGWMEGVGLQELNNVVVEQFTGLHDKNGKEIYEGDILGDKAVVKWFESLVWDNGGSEHPGFYCKQWIGFCGMEYHYGFDGVEVIGNIHENPELLES